VQPRPGRPPTISLDQVVAAAIELADEVGLASCTMRSVADRVGVTPMALYRHVRDKEHLLELVPDALLAGVADAVRRRRSGVMALREVADGVRVALEAHPWATPLFQQPCPGPNMAAASEHCVALLIAEGASPDDAFRWLRAVVAQVIGEMLTAHGEFDPAGVDLLLASIGRSRRRTRRT
jgi:AcrR family transcriptional regulator